MNPITLQYLIFFFLGIIWGSVNYWSKKVMWCLGIIAIITSVFTRFEGWDYSEQGISNWHYFGLVPSVWLGSWIGEISCKAVWGERLI